MIARVLAVLVLAQSTVALGFDPEAVPMSQLTDVAADPATWAMVEPLLPSSVAQFVPLVLAFLVTMRAVAELLLVLARLVPAARGVSDKVVTAVNLAAKAAAFVGLGMPKQLVVAKAEAITAKEASRGTSVVDRVVHKAP